MFGSFDPVAIDSVGLDFLRSEYGDRLGGSYYARVTANGGVNADNYLHEAALADQPPSGTVYQPDGFRLASLGVHEHWNNAADKQYSRNLDPHGSGIELLTLHALPAMSVSIVSPTNGEVLNLETNLLLQTAITTNYSSVQRVDFYRRASFTGPVTNAPFSLVWTNAPAGAWPLWCVAFDTDNYAVTSAVVNVTIGASTNVLPFILSQPIDQTGTLGGSAAFSVDAGGWPIPDYHWRKNGMDVAGATNANLWISNLTGSDAGLYSVMVSNVAGALLSSEARLTMTVPLAKAIYAFEGDALDSSGNGYHGSNNGATFSTGKIGGWAAQFDGANAWVLLPPAVVTRSFTIGTWLKTTDAGGVGQWYDGEALVDDRLSLPMDDYGLSLSGGKFSFGTGNPDMTLTSSILINDGIWHHVAATFDQVGIMKIYIDGILDGVTNNHNSAVWPLPGGLHIGNCSDGSHYFAGALDELEFYDRVLAASEIASLAGISPPVFPTGLSAAGGNGQVALRWNYVMGAGSYVVKRALAVEGPYITVTNGLTTTGFTNRGLANGTVYYFVVSAVNSAGESVPSAPVGAETHAPPQIDTSVSSGGNDMELSWPGWAANYAVYTTTNLAVPLWLPVAGLPRPTNGLLHLTLPVTNDGARFFRLGAP
jgi:hypothetical protein